MAPEDLITGLVAVLVVDEFEIYRRRALGA